MDRRVFFQISSSLFYYVRIALNLYKFSSFSVRRFFINMVRTVLIVWVLSCQGNSFLKLHRERWRSTANGDHLYWIWWNANLLFSSSLDWNVIGCQFVWENIYLWFDIDLITIHFESRLFLEIGMSISWIICSHMVFGAENISCVVLCGWHFMGKIWQKQANIFTMEKTVHLRMEMINGSFWGANIG